MWLVPHCSCIQSVLNGKKCWWWFFIGIAQIQDLGTGWEAWLRGNAGSWLLGWNPQCVTVPRVASFHCILLESQRLYFAMPCFLNSDLTLWGLMWWRYCTQKGDTHAKRTSVSVHRCYVASTILVGLGCRCFTFAYMEDWLVITTLPTSPLFSFCSLSLPCLSH